jgi:hypothetical protein
VGLGLNRVNACDPIFDWNLDQDQNVGIGPFSLLKPMQCYHSIFEVGISPHLLKILEAIDT